MKIAPLTVSVALICIGCTREEEAAPTAPVTSFKVPIVAAPERVAGLAAIRPPPEQALRLATGQVLELDIRPLSAVQAAEKITSGEVQPGLWLAPASAVVDIVNSKATNVNLRFDECETLHETELVFVLHPSDAAMIHLDVKALNPLELFTENGEESVDSLVKLLPRFAVASPARSDSGLLAMSFLSQLAKGDMSRALRPETVNSPEWKQVWQQLHRKILRVATSDASLLDQVAQQPYRHPLIALTTLQAYQDYASKHPESRLVALPFTGVSLRGAEVLCMATASYLTPDEKTAYSLVLKALSHRALRNNTQFAAKPLTQRDEVDTTVRVPVPNGDTLQEVLRSWKDLRSTGSVMLVLDNSGNTDRAFLDRERSHVKDFMQRFASGPSRPRVGFMAFGTTIEVLSPPTLAGHQEVQKLDFLRSGGGSRIYDAIVDALQLLEQNQERTSASIVVMTDSDDRGSNIPAGTFQEMIGRTLSERDIMVYVVEVSGSRTAVSSLQTTIPAVGGIYVRATSETLAMELEKIWIELVGW